MTQQKFRVRACPARLEDAATGDDLPGRPAIDLACGIEKRLDAIDHLFRRIFLQEVARFADFV